MTPPTRLSLLNALKDPERKPEAWVAFQRLYEPVIAVWCLRKGLQHADADDVTQKVLLRLYEALPGHEHAPDRGPFRAWLSAVVSNAVRDHVRRLERHPDWRAAGGSEALELLGKLQAPAALDELFGSLESPIGPELEQAMVRARGRVAESTWAVYEQVDLHERPVAEAATTAGVSVAAAYEAVYRVRRIIAEEYVRQQHLPTLAGGGPSDADHLPG